MSPKPRRHHTARAAGCSQGNGSGDARHVRRQREGSGPTLRGWPDSSEWVADFRRNGWGLPRNQWRVGSDYALFPQCIAYPPIHCARAYHCLGNGRCSTKEKTPGNHGCRREREDISLRTNTPAQKFPSKRQISIANEWCPDVGRKGIGDIAAPGIRRLPEGVLVSGALTTCRPQRARGPLLPRAELLALSRNRWAAEL